jgi:hypothetical protein
VVAVVLGVVGGDGDGVGEVGWGAVPVGFDGGGGAVGVGPDDGVVDVGEGPGAFVHEAVVEAAEADEVVEGGVAAVGAVDDVVGVEPLGGAASREAAGAVVAAVQGTAESAVDDGGGGADVAAVAVVFDVDGVADVAGPAAGDHRCDAGAVVGALGIVVVGVGIVVVEYGGVGDEGEASDVASFGDDFAAGAAGAGDGVVDEAGGERVDGGVDGFGHVVGGAELDRGQSVVAAAPGELSTLEGDAGVSVFVAVEGVAHGGGDAFEF